MFMSNHKGEKNKMTELREKLEKIEKKTTKNIVELEKIPIDVEIVERGPFKEGTDEQFCIDVVVVNGEEYYMPFSAQIALKELLVRFPNMKEFSVMKTGEGKTTRYQVIPLGV